MPSAGEYLPVLGGYFSIASQNFPGEGGKVQPAGGHIPYPEAVSHTEEGELQHLFA